MKLEPQYIKVLLKTAIREMVKTHHEVRSDLWSLLAHRACGVFIKVCPLGKSRDMLDTWSGALSGNTQEKHKENEF